MNRFRSHRGPRRAPDDDPTRMLQFWRDQQAEERLADTQELPQFLDDEPVAAGRRPTAPRRRRVSLVIVAGLATLGVVGGVAVATAAGRPDAGGVTSTGPTASSSSPGTATSPSTSAPSATRRPGDLPHTEV